MKSVASVFPVQPADAVGGSFRSLISLLQIATGAATRTARLLTDSNEGYLAPLESAQSRIDADLAWLWRSPSDREQTRLDFAALRALPAQKLNELSKTVDLARSDHPNQALEIVRTSQGKDLMDQIRDGRRISRTKNSGALKRQSALCNAAILNAIQCFWELLSFIGWAYRRIRNETIVRSNSLTEIKRQKIS